VSPNPRHSLPINHVGRINSEGVAEALERVPRPSEQPDFPEFDGVRHYRCGIFRTAKMDWQWRTTAVLQ